MTARAVPEEKPAVEVSVVVPAYNAAATIARCVGALRTQNWAGPYEVIVVDDGSDDNTGTIAAMAGAQVVTIPRSRPAAARNAGIAAAQGTVICCTDADCEPAEDWLAQIVAPLQDPAVAAAKGIYATRQTSLVARFVQLEYEDKYDRMALAPAIDFVDTYSAAYQRAALAEHGGFDERFLYLEDQELSFRLAAAGERMVFQPNAVVYHQHAATLAAYMRKKATIGYWKAQVVRRFPERLISDSHTPQVMKLQMVLAALLLLALAAAVLAVLAGWRPIAVAASAAALFTFLAFLATTLPFDRKAWSKDRTVALMAPLLLFCRALSLGAGTAWGLLAPPASRPDRSGEQPAADRESLA